jgi:hypothetical protein
MFLFYNIKSHNLILDSQLRMDKPVKKIGGGLQGRES